MHCHRPQKLQGFSPSLFEGECRQSLCTLIYMQVHFFTCVLRTSSATCTPQKAQDRYAVASVKSRTASLPQSESERRLGPFHFSLNDIQHCCFALPTCRLHGSRQRPPGGRSTPRHPSASSDPEGEERRREPIGFSLWEPPEQRQVLKLSGVFVSHSDVRGRPCAFDSIVIFPLCFCCAARRRSPTPAR